LEEEGNDRAKALLRAEPGEVPPFGAADRVLVALGVGAAAGSVVVTAKGATAASKWLLIGVIGGAVVFGGIVVQRMSRAPSTSPRPVEAVQVVETPPVETPPAEVPVVAQAAPESTEQAAIDSAEPLAARPAAKAPLARRAARESSDPNESLRLEIGALDAARAALGAGQPSRALALLDDYHERFSPGHFEPEAFVIRLDALVRSGDGATAKRLAREYLATHPTTSHAPRIRRILDGAPP
jgi:hypothetical protein